MIISSQRHRNSNITATKLADQDFTVILSPEFDIDGLTVQVVLDGHHSLEAAKQAGVEPDYEIANHSTCDWLEHLDNDDPEAFLEASYMDDDYYDINTGRLAF